MPTPVRYPAGRVIAFNVGVGMHDLSLMASGNGFSSATLTAHAGGGQANATPLGSAINLVAVSATAGDSCMLPPATGGQLMWISNAGAAASQVFAALGTADTINGTAGSTGVSLAAGKSDVFMSPLAGAWFTVASA